MLTKDWVREILTSYSGAFNDKLFTFLGDEGYTGSLPDRFMAFWSDKGYTGSYNDRLRQWEASLQRYFLPFDPVLNSYAELDTAFQPSGDFEIEALVSTVNSGAADIAILNGTNQSNNSIGVRIRPDGKILAFAFVGSTLQTTITSTAIVDDGQLHIVKLTYTGTTLELFVDGVGQGTVTWALDGNQNIKFIGYRPVSLQYFDGYIADVKLTDDVTPANSRIFPLAVGAGATENSTINSGSITINNIPDADRKLFTFDEANNRWVGPGGTPILEVA